MYRTVLLSLIKIEETFSIPGVTVWVCPASHNCAALLLRLAVGRGDGGAGEAGDDDRRSGTGAAGCSKRCAASLSQCVVPLSLKENKNLYQIKFQRNYL